MKILTLDEAIEKVPAIMTETPSPRASARYSFFSTRNVVERALSSGWHIVEAKGARVRGSGSKYGAHSVRFIHESQRQTLDSSATLEGFPTINLINSHDLTKKLTMAIGYYRLICSNGLIAPSGMANSVNSRHNFNEEKSDVLLNSIDRVFEQYSVITNQINDFRQRELSDLECDALSKFAKRIRFRFRPSAPAKLDHNLFLRPRRPLDNGKDLWRVFNVIQENVTHGGEGMGKGITRFQDDLRFNTEMWTGAAKALSFRGSNLEDELNRLFVKKSRDKGNSFDVASNN